MTNQQTPPTAPVSALQIEGLRKTFGAKTAVDDVSLAVPAGACYGIVGPNGAGKTTTLSMAVGLLRPDAGGVRVFGHDVWGDPVAAKALFGVLPDGYALPDRLTARELLHLLGALRGLERDEIEQRTDSLIDLMELGGAASTLIADYSAGMTKKIGIATAMLHNPGLLILDEPFESVDPVSALAIRRVLMEYVRSGGAVVISSHSMLLVESICTHVAVMVAGRVAADGTLAEVRAEGSLEEAFMRLAGSEPVNEELLAWFGR
ncbi:ABC transporter ATP-binding protein [Brachybacterium sacelli]|uniref:ABC-2 type transport system ATP-binding protein n=1 Tax=Brachybacterium sacelli TaxID=173364 RepID=A0ABS4X6B5_9MICO|nr:ABC transporter ATP-binding protein [Brachybacterium sacelli]MBP2383999.1 ABC-2 type transport system ATP-binding protein [Brachybacterium sacelli]